jgi:AcrR family transcriptional regulator
VSASDAPQPQAGLRTRSGNAMLRTRSAILDAAARVVEQHGVRRTTMTRIAAEGGIAKATLYNHFRTKEDVLAALVEARVATLAQECAAAGGVQPALEHAARQLAGCAPLRRVAADEPDLLLPLLVPGDSRGWQQTRDAVQQVVPHPDEAEVVLRWLLGSLLWPADVTSAAVLVRGLQGASGHAPPGRVAGRRSAAGLGWPAEPDRLRTR